MLNPHLHGGEFMGNYSRIYWTILNARGYPWGLFFTAFAEAETGRTYLLDLPVKIKKTASPLFTSLYSEKWPISHIRQNP